MRFSGLIPTRDYVCNHLVSHIPFAGLRMWAYRRLGLRIGEQSIIFMNTEFIDCRSATIGKGTVIGNHCCIDARGGLVIGNNVNISSYTLLIAGSHDVQSVDFAGSAQPITVEDDVWLCTHCTILAGVTVGRGAVVAACAVATKNIPPYTIVAGIPAKAIGQRKENLHYDLSGFHPSWI
jgi:maltose O-acetyltransferase